MLKKETLKRAISETKKIRWRQLYKAYLLNTNQPIPKNRFKIMIAQLIIKYTNYRVRAYHLNKSYFSTFVVLLTSYAKNRELKEFVNTTNSQFFQFIQVTVFWDTKSGFMIKVDTVFPYFYDIEGHNEVYKENKYAKDQLIERTKYFSRNKYISKKLLKK